MKPVFIPLAMGRAVYALALTACLLLAAAVAAQPAPAPQVTLANVWRSGFEVKDFLVSEKFDGVRAIWDGRELRFRSGRPVPAPVWFVAALPAVPLDGELWLGRGRFDEMSAIARSDGDDGRWRQVRYLVFDLPEAPGSFAERVAAMQVLLGSDDAPAIPCVRAVRQFHVGSERALRKELARVVAAGGEGLMLHRADAPWRSGRGDDLLKLKPFEDAEATVVGHEAGKGRLRGQVGALLMQMPEAQGGGRFRLGAGLTDALRRNPPPLGTRITYRYTALTKNGLPRFPRFWRVRADP